MARPARRQGNLPAEATSFIGRRRELAEVRKKLAQARLVSLVGPGGVGKTRLAIRIATDLGRGFRDGGWLVELAEVVDTAGVSTAAISTAAMAALDLRDQAQTDPLTLLLSYLRDKELLLVVDNCEHVLAAAGQLVTEVLRAAPGVRVIATSREPLSVTGEHIVPVPSLDLPPPHAAEPITRLRQNEAVMLFTQRAAAASGNFELTRANQAAVVELCRRLDGLPLAIELAAVRTRVLAVEQILDRLADRFGLLTGGSRAARPRHQTLRTTIDWSHDLLADGERAVLRRCCAFAGRFTVDDVEAVCTSPDVPAAQALDLLSSLVDKSLVIREDWQGPAGYRLHETMREFAALKLAEAGEEDAVGQRCAEYYLWAATQRSGADDRYRLPEQLAWADLEIDNIRAVLERCRGRGDTAAGLGLAVSLGWYWVTRATTEGTRWLDHFLAAAAASDPAAGDRTSGDPTGGDPAAGDPTPGDPAAGDEDTLAWAYFIRGFLAVLKADPVSAGPALRAAIAAARRAGKSDVLSEALSMASIAESMVGHRTVARRLLDEARVTAADAAYPPGRISVLQAQVLNGFFWADLGAVRSGAAEGARLAREAGDLYALEMMLLNLGSAALLTGDLDESRPPLGEALRIAGQIDDRVAQFYLLAAFGCHAGLSGRPRLAAQLLGASETARTLVGANRVLFLGDLLAKTRQTATAALGAAAFEAEFDAGRGLGRDRALGLALGKPAKPAAPASPAPTPVAAGPLGKRETEVARLVADGLTNKQIGTRLFISERTVDSHVRNILNKLGFNARAQIAAWMTAPEQ